MYLKLQSPVSTCSHSQLVKYSSLVSSLDFQTMTRVSVLHVHGMRMGCNRCPKTIENTYMGETIDITMYTIVVPNKCQFPALWLTYSKNYTRGREQEQAVNSCNIDFSKYSLWHIDSRIYMNHFLKPILWQYSWPVSTWQTVFSGE